MIHQLPCKLRDFWKGCIFGSIVHAIGMTKFACLANENSWDGVNHSVQDSCGSRGTVAFLLDQQGSPISCVGALFNMKSERATLEQHIPPNPMLYFNNPKEEQTKLAETAFQYLLDKFDS